MASREIHGHVINLEPVEPDDVVTDVIILTRRVHHDDVTGKLKDYLTINTTLNTTGMIQRGMIYEALDAFVSPDEE